MSYFGKKEHNVRYDRIFQNKQHIYSKQFQIKVLLASYLNIRQTHCSMFFGPSFFYSFDLAKNSVKSVSVRGTILASVTTGRYKKSTFIIIIDVSFFWLFSIKYLMILRSEVSSFLSFRPRPFIMRVKQCEWVWLLNLTARAYRSYQAKSRIS